MIMSFLCSRPSTYQIVIETKGESSVLYNGPISRTIVDQYVSRYPFIGSTDEIMEKIRMNQTFLKDDEEV